MFGWNQFPTTEMEMATPRKHFNRNKSSVVGASDFNSTGYYDEESQQSILSPNEEDIKVSRGPPLRSSSVLSNHRLNSKRMQRREDRGSSQPRFLSRASSYNAIKSWRNLTRASSMINSIKNFSSSRIIGYEHKSAKLRILALHGKASNGEVAKLQLANLGITEDDYSIVYLNGPILEKDGDPEIRDLCVGGPFYSWFQSNYTDARFRPSFVRAITHVFTALQRLGPFDIVYGFSQGATIAAFAALSFSDVELKKILIESNLHQYSGGSMIGPGDLHQHSITLSFEILGRTGNSKILSKMSMVARNEITEVLFNRESFFYMLLACPVDDPADIKKGLGMKGSIMESSVGIPSSFLIGINDAHKQNAERMTYLFSDVQVRYINSGHAVNRMVGCDKDLLYEIQGCLEQCQNPTTIEEPSLQRLSEISSVSLVSTLQVAHVKVDERGMKNTLLKVLSHRDRKMPLFYEARETDEGRHTSYGDVLDFIQGGEGDLRRLNVLSGEVVVYCCPSGAGAVPAMAFLSIMAQTTAAPLAPGLNESDTAYVLDHFNAKHLILFENIESPGIEAAFEKYAASGKALLHRATIRNKGKPGMFRYTRSGEKHLDEKWELKPCMEALENPPDSVGLLLTTSGTTSKPKGVPLLQSSLIRNGYIIASSLGLTEIDVCYSIMPLFHIGGISASILCSITAGGSICCDKEAYDAKYMVDAIAISNPQPTWYSAVPTIHNETVRFIKEMATENEKLKVYGVNKEGVWKRGHSLRMIRSGAAALLGPHAIALSETYGDIPIIPTYSMSEQMPITQPPAGKTDMIIHKPGSVGIPVAASLAIVNSSTLRPLPYGQEGEIAICSSTVMNKYLHNQEVDRKVFFELTLPTNTNFEGVRGRYFLTGDVGILDNEGYLTLRGRNKELIKRGGEQISPFEIETHLLAHPWVKTSVCFAVPSQTYGEEAGAAIVLSKDAPPDLTIDKIVKEMRNSLRRKDVSALKWPSKWKVVDDDDLPKTKTNKHIRIGLSKKLNFESGEQEGSSFSRAKGNAISNTFIDWDVIVSFRFILACYVMFMHLGTNESWGALCNLRRWPWHVHVFFTLGGYSLSAPMNPIIEKKFKYFIARIGAMYPMYSVALFFVFINMLVSCRPSTFRPDFHWDAQPDDLYIDGDKRKGLSPIFCEGTPATPKSYWASLFLTMLIYTSGLAITPIFLMSWWMGFYFWFSAMYYQCLMIFPTVYNCLAKWRSDTTIYFSIIVTILIFDQVLLWGTWFISKDYKGYNHYAEGTGIENDPDARHDAHKHNIVVLSWYLFSPFWMVYFIVGASAAYLYDAYRPAEKSNSHIWGNIADGCTLIVIIWSICLISQGDIQTDVESNYGLHPKEADNYTDSAVTNRLWDNICGRLVAPLTTLWVFSLSTGKAQWYFAATRNGHWWNWWRYRKTMYWFSPSPVPVEWYEYLYLVTLTVWFSALVNATALPLANTVLTFMTELLIGTTPVKELNVEETLIDILEDMTGLAPQPSWTLEQCGLASLGLPQLAQKLQKSFSTKYQSIPVSAATLSPARTVGDIVEILSKIKALSHADGL